VVINNPITSCICRHTTLWNINARKQAIKDKLQGDVATYLRCGWVVNNQILKKKFIAESLGKKIKSPK